jgi:hypothetical protein
VATLFCLRQFFLRGGAKTIFILCPNEYTPDRFSARSANALFTEVCINPSSGNPDTRPLLTELQMLRGLLRA